MPDSFYAPKAAALPGGASVLSNEYAFPKSYVTIQTGRPCPLLPQLPVRGGMRRQKTAARAKFRQRPSALRHSDGKGALLFSNAPQFFMPEYPVLCQTIFRRTFFPVSSPVRSGRRYRPSSYTPRSPDSSLHCKIQRSCVPEVPSGCRRPPDTWA